MKAFPNRLRLLSLLILLFALFLIAKLYAVQIISGEDFKIKAEHQYVAGVNYFDRGSIFFTTSLKPSICNLLWSKIAVKLLSL